MMVMNCHNHLAKDVMSFFKYSQMELQKSSPALKENNFGMWAYVFQGKFSSWFQLADLDKAHRHSENLIIAYMSE